MVSKIANTEIALDPNNSVIKRLCYKEVVVYLSKTNQLSFVHVKFGSTLPSPIGHNARD